MCGHRRIGDLHAGIRENLDPVAESNGGTDRPSFEQLIENL
jgi:hypothetical protein